VAGQIDILVVEDTPSDQRLLQEALLACNSRLRIHIVGSGTEAIEYLFKNRKPPPRLVLLDLHLPGKSGKQVLSEIKSAPSMAAIPVLMFSTSCAADDISSCYELGANAYLTKPSVLEDYYTAIKIIQDFWFKVAQLPTGTN